MRQVLINFLLRLPFAIKMRFRVAWSGAHFDIRSNSVASSGLLVSLGCGPLLPHTMRSGAAFTYAFATLVRSA